MFDTLSFDSENVEFIPHSQSEKHLCVLLFYLRCSLFQYYSFFFSIWVYLFRSFCCDGIFSRSQALIHIFSHRIVPCSILNRSFRLFHECIFLSVSSFIYIFFRKKRLILYYVLICPWVCCSFRSRSNCCAYRSVYLHNEWIDFTLWYSTSLYSICILRSSVLSFFKSPSSVLSTNLLNWTSISHVALVLTFSIRTNIDNIIFAAPSHSNHNSSANKKHWQNKKKRCHSMNERNNESLKEKEKHKPIYQKQNNTLEFLKYFDVVMLFFRFSSYHFSPK